MAPIARLLALVVMMGTLGGCISGDDAGTEPSGQIRLQDLESCDFRYPDGTPIPCQSQSTAVMAYQPSPGLTDGYVCIGGATDRYTFYQSMTDQDEWVIGYDYRFGERPVHGVAIGERGAGREAFTLASWTHGPGPGSGTIPPEFAEADNLVVRLYMFYLESNDTIWQDAEVIPLWSIHDGSAWLIWRIESDHGTHYVHNMGEYIFGDSEQEFRFWAPFPIHYVGVDFEFTLTWHWNGGFGMGATNLPVGGQFSNCLPG